MDKDQIIYKLKSAIEEGKLLAFEKECTDNISQIDLYIKKLCKNNYSEFLQSLTSVQQFRDGIKTIRKDLNEMHTNIQQVDKEYLSKVTKSLEQKQNYYNACEAVRQFQSVKRVIERTKKVESLIAKDLLSVAFHELETLKLEAQEEKVVSMEMKQWLWKRINTIEEKLFKIMQNMKTKILSELEEQEMEAGQQVLDEVKKFIQILGKQFMLESDQDSREIKDGTVYQKNNGSNNAAAQYMSMKRSQMGFSFYKSGAGPLGSNGNDKGSRRGSNVMMASLSNMMRMSKYGALGGAGAQGNGIIPKFQDRQSLAQIAFSKVGNLPKYDTPRQKQASQDFNFLISPGSMTDRDNNNNRQATQVYTLESIQRQANVTQDIIVDVDFTKIDNTRKLFQNIEQDNVFIDYLQQERISRLLKLSKLPRRINTEECLTRIIGFFVIQIHLGYNLPSVFNPDTLRNYWEQCFLQIQKSLEQLIMDYDYQPITQTKKDMVHFILGIRDIGLIQDLSFLNTLIKLHDVYIDKLLNVLSKRVNEILEFEDYNLVQVNNSEELFRTVDKYEIDLSKYFGMNNQTLKLTYPIYLPYSISVVKLNDLIQSFIEENFQYWQFLLADKADFTLAYSSCDKILCRVIELLSEHFFHKNKFTILQRAQFCSNLDYTLKSFGFFKRTVFQLANQGAYNFNKDIYGFQFQSENYMMNFKTKCEESIFTELRQKISDFLSILEGLQWRPKKPDSKHHDFVEDLVQFLRSTIVTLDQQNKELAQKCYLTAFQHLSARITEVLANCKGISQINMAGILNLYQDYLYLTKFAKEQMVDNQQMFELGMGELQQMISLFIESSQEQGVREILDDDLFRKKYVKINLRKLVLILEKFKDDKVVNGQTNNPEIEQIITKMPKIKKSEALGVAKKLRESLNFQK